MIDMRFQSHLKDEKRQKTEEGVTARPMSKSATAKDNVSQLVVLCKRLRVNMRYIMRELPTTIRPAITQRIIQYHMAGSAAAAFAFSVVFRGLDELGVGGIADLGFGSVLVIQCTSVKEKRGRPCQIKYNQLKLLLLYSNSVSLPELAAAFSARSHRPLPKETPSQSRENGLESGWEFKLTIAGLVSFCFFVVL